MNKYFISSSNQEKNHKKQNISILNFHQRLKNVSYTFFHGHTK